MNKSVSEDGAFVARTSEQECGVVMIFPRMIEIGLSKYFTEPEHPHPAVRMMVRNALRLAVAHLGAKDTASLIVETLSERALSEPVAR